MREILHQNGYSRDKQPKIIGVTGHVHDHYKMSGLKAGMDEIYSKPLYFETMKEVLQKYNIIDNII